MTYDPSVHHRRSIRLRAHDYATGGAYYVTICAEERKRLFGVVVNGRMALNDAGRMATHWFRELENKFSDVQCDAFVCMPDHLHFVVRTGFVGADLCVRPEKKGEHAGSPLRAIVAWFKTMTTNAYICGVKQSGWAPFPGTLWQRTITNTSCEHADLDRIRTYIRDNPINADVLRFGEPRFMIGNQALLDLPKTAYLAPVSYGRTAYPPLSAFPTPPRCVISSFLSPMERRVFSACLSNGTPAIQLLACGLPKVFPLRTRHALDAGHLLIMTPFDETVTQVNAARAAWCNQYLLHAADTVVIGALNPNGQLDCLLADMPFNKPIHLPVQGGFPCTESR
jgi:REP element-mobilizing transposase RayT